ncbi:amidohydrolase family protein [Bacillus sp. Marseille-P3661]|uniref:amidohydrolase family protein n=1 Tax=Bacillus sp. Marseille-P3661 TaxID=1936234 RepID=UPI000C83BDAA|nr:amidohydrolase family protein [Bacillus sp. Marseille-P3661]
MYDFHTHFITPDVQGWLQENKDRVNAKWVNKGEGKEDFLVVNGKWGFELKQTFINPTQFLNEQEKVGVTHSVVSPIPQLFMYDFSDDITSELSNVYNQSLAIWAKTEHNRISALGTVPLNNPESAAHVLREAMNNGLKGVIIGPGLPNKMLSDEFFAPFFEEADKQKAIVFIHPLLSEDPRLTGKMPNLIGVPWETTVCATDLLLSGFLDKYPNIKLLLAHGGGLLPYQIGRLDKGYTMWGDVSTLLQAPPIEYLRKFWFDSVLWNNDSLDFLIKTVGEDRVVPGSDFPFDLCTWPPQVSNEKGVQSLLSK